METEQTVTIERTRLRLDEGRPPRCPEQQWIWCGPVRACTLRAGHDGRHEDEYSGIGWIARPEGGEEIPHGA